MPVGEPQPIGPRHSPLPDRGSGLVVSPFRAVRYTTPDRSALGRLTSPAYDLIDPAKRAVLEQADPYNIVSLILPRQDPRSGDDRYSGAAARLADWRQRGILAADPTPAVYRYEMTEGNTVTRGLVATVDLPLTAGRVILPHEDTMPGPVADRLALLRATHANFEPIVLVYDGDDPTTDADFGAPIAEVRGDDGVEHVVWALTDPAAIDTIRAAMASRTAVIADGHHRYASYLQYRDHQHRDHQHTDHQQTDGAGPFDRALVYLVALGSQGLRTQAIHRVLPGLDLAAAVDGAARVFDVEAVAAPQLAAPQLAAPHVAAPDFAAPQLTGPEQLVATLGRHEFLLTDGRAWYRLRHPDPTAVRAAIPTDRSTTWQNLDVTLAHSLLIEHAWGLPDDETTVRFGYDVVSTLDAVRSGGTALLLPSTPPASVLAVAGQGERMPRKSTLFVPKPRTGLLLRCYSDEH